MKRLAVRHGRNIAGIDDMAKRSLALRMAITRELENTMERIIVLKRDEGMITVSDLPSISQHRAGGGEVGLAVVSCQKMV